MIYSYDGDIAVELGVNAATIYHGIQFWCATNEGNGHNIHEGRAWVYNSVEGWRKIYPQFTIKQIRIALQKLEDAGLVLSGNFNSKQYDRTKWYADLCPQGQKHLPSRANGIAQKGKPIPDNNTITIRDTRTRDWPDWLPLDAWVGFVNMRNATMKPMTDRAVQNLLTKLEKMRADGQDVAEVLDQSTNACWADVYEVKERRNGKQRTQVSGTATAAQRAIDHYEARNH